MEYVIRPIQKADNAQVAQIIRTVMTEFDCVGEGFSIEDPEVDDMHGNYQGDRQEFYVVEAFSDQLSEVHSAFAKTIVLVAGYAQLTGEGESICELRKMYGLPSSRGKGLGKKLMEKILSSAKADGFKQMYLETASSMKEAAGLYKRFGFEYIEGSLGHTGHGGCDDFMLKEL